MRVDSGFYRGLLLLLGMSPATGCQGYTVLLASCTLGVCACDIGTAKPCLYSGTETCIEHKHSTWELKHSKLTAADRT